MTKQAAINAIISLTRGNFSNFLNAIFIIFDMFIKTVLPVHHVVDFYLYFWKMKCCMRCSISLFSMFLLKTLGDNQLDNLNTDFGIVGVMYFD